MYALLFADTGMSVWQLSSLFALWSLTGVLLEVPSGAWADAVSRRLPLVLGPLLTAVGFTLWVLLPSYAAFAAGFVLWGTRGALGSGALEALVHDELTRLGAAHRYARVMGRARAAGLLAVMASMGAAGPVLDAGGYAGVGAASVLGCLLTAAVALCFPEHREAGVRGEGWAVILRGGVAVVRAPGALRRALFLVPAVGAVWGALDEYAPLLVRETGVSDRAVPWLLSLVWAGATAGSLLAGPAARLGTRGFAVLLAGAAGALALGAGIGTPAGLGLVAVAFGGFQLATVLADARLQERIEVAGRATVTSVAGLATEVVTVGVYGAYAALAAGFDHGVVFCLFAVVYAGVAVGCWVRVRGGRSRSSPRP